MFKKMNVITAIVAVSIIFGACGVEQNNSAVSENTFDSVANIETTTTVVNEESVSDSVEDVSNISEVMNTDMTIVVTDEDVDVADDASEVVDLSGTVTTGEEIVAVQSELELSETAEEVADVEILPFATTESFDFDSIITATNSVGITENELNAMVTNLVASYNSGTMMNVSYDYVSSVTDWYSYYQIVMRNTVKFVAFNSEGHKYLLIGVQDSDGSADNWYYFIDVTKGIELGSAGFEEQDFSLCEDRYFIFVTNTKRSDGYNQQIIDLLSGEIVYDELSENFGYLNQVYGMNSIVKF